VAHPDANIIFGAVIDDAMGDEIRVTVIAAGFDRWDEKKAGDAEGRSAASIFEQSAVDLEAGTPDIFGDEEQDDADIDGDDDFDVPSFLR
jgi:cell division protein FtsZ